MKYYAVSDVHGYYSILMRDLTTAGFFDQSDSKLIICGDLFDRGEEALKMQQFVLRLMRENRIILIRGNHEDLFESMILDDLFNPLHKLNKTWYTALQLTGFTNREAGTDPDGFCEACRNTPFYQTIIPNMLNFFETKNYVFTHGWVPNDSNWRYAGEEKWRRARWKNGMDEVLTNPVPFRTVVCGHYHTSYGHSKFELNGSELGDDACFDIFRAPGIIALDGCVMKSGRINVAIIEDEPI